MSRRGGRALAIVALAVPAALGVGACSDDEKRRFSDEKIVEKLNLEETDAGYAIDGDPFCEVSERLLNTAEEVERADESSELDLVIASRGGNAGVEGIPPFANPCPEMAQKKLNRLDPKPED